ncbi:MAG: tetratricopeptide repeat protein [Planctomycetes bacterium]|nr:tetratricopeptide repeat protein [Planctomycetota bacterium]
MKGSDPEPTVPDPVRAEPTLVDSQARRAVESPASGDLPGRLYGRYRLLEELGRGGMGVVWKAHDTTLDRVVALKRIRGEAALDAALAERFEREARAAARLAHPNIVTVHDVGLCEGERYLTCEYVAGETLDRRMKEGLSARKAVEIVCAVAQALQHAHDQGIVHRDVKPGNILVDSQDRPRVTDFGLAKDLRLASGGSLTQTGAVLGTPRYMSPEQAEGATDEIGPASDQFSLGVVLYELVTGRTPFRGETLRGILNSICAEEPEPPDRLSPQVSPGLARVCLKALAKDPANRYTTIADFATDLARQVGLRLARPRGATSAARPRPRGRGRRLALISVLGASVAVATLLAVVIYKVSWRSPDGAAPGQHGPPPGEETSSERSLGKTLASCEEILDRARESLYQEDIPHEAMVEKVEVVRERLAEALEATPRSARGSHLLGRAWEFTGWWDRAEACWKKAIELDPEFAPARLDLARILLVRSYLAWCRKEEGRATWFAEAERLALEAISQIEAAAARGGGGESDSLRLLADWALALARGDSQAARRIAESGIERFRGNRGEEEFHFALAQALQIYREQAAACDRAIALRPRHALALRTRAICRRELGEMDAAIADLDLTISLEPRFAAAYNSRGYVRREKGDLDAAIADFGEAIRLDPGYAYPYANRGTVWRQKKEWDAAIEDFSRAVRLAPDYAAALWNRGWIYYLKDEYEKALADYDEAIRIDPGYAKLWNERGLVRMDSGDLAGALADLEEAIRLDSDYAPAYHNRGRARQAAGDLAGALSDYGERIRLGPEDPTPYYRRGSLRLSMGDAPGAVADLEKSLAIAANDWEYHKAAEENLEEARRRRDGKE